MTTKKLTENQLQDVLTAIDMRLNYIQTGDVLFSKMDAIAFNASLGKNDKHREVPIKRLTEYQDQTLTNLRRAREALLRQPLK